MPEMAEEAFRVQDARLGDFGVEARGEFSFGKALGTTGG